MVTFKSKNECYLIFNKQKCLIELHSFFLNTKENSIIFVFTNYNKYVQTYKCISSIFMIIIGYCYHDKM